MDAAAKKWIQQYKKLFDQVAARNAGMNVVEDVTTVEGKEQIKKIGKLVDEPGGTATQVPNKVIKKIGKIVPEESAEGTPSTASGPPPSRGRLGAESNKKTASGTKVQDSGERFAIKKDDRGNNYVEVDSVIVDSLNTPKQIADILSEIVRTKFNDFVKVDGQKIGINQKTSREWIWSKDAKKLLKNDNQAFLDKVNAFSNADELLQVANDYIGEARKHKRKDNFVEFARGNVSFSVDGRGYVADVIVGTTKSGAAVLYDIVNLRSKKIVAETSNTKQVRRGDVSATINSIHQTDEKINPSGENISENVNLGERSALADGKRATAGEVAAVKSSISKRGIDPKGIIAIADKYFARYSGQLTRTGVRYEFLAAADMLFDLTAESGDRAYASVEALAEELVTNEKDTSGMTEDIKEMKRHIREITFDVREWA